MNKERLHKIAVCVFNSKHGDFLRTFADAYLRTDLENEVILRGTWALLIQKYSLDEECPKDEEAMA